MSYTRLEDLKDISGKRALVRVDFNVPQNENKKITDDTRIRAALPTIKYLQNQGCSIVLCSHLGRPNGEMVKKYSLFPVAQRLAQLLLEAEMPDEVIWVEDIIGENAEERAAELSAGQVLLLENLRFKSGEKSNNMKFAEALSRLGDFYVNDAFGVSHREHASVNALPKQFEIRAAGLLVEKELAALEKVLHNKETPCVAVVGGVKVSDKIPMIQNLARICDSILVGGAMTFTFRKALSMTVGKSIVEDEKLEIARKIIQYCKLQNCKLHLPSDFICASNFSEDAEASILEEIPDDLMALDIGPETQVKYAEILKEAKCIFWNGPMGVFEWESFSSGTKCVGKAMAEAEGYTVVGGGDSAAAASLFGYADLMNHVSTGGGASLALIEGNVLPGIEFLT